MLEARTVEQEGDPVDMESLVVVLGCRDYIYMLVIIEIPYWCPITIEIPYWCPITTRAQREPSGDIETVFRDPLSVGSTTRVDEVGWVILKLC